MTLTLLETIQRIIREELARLRTAELGVVQRQHPHAGASDKDNYACTVQLRDSGIVLEQVPVATPRIGAVSIPAVGDLVLVEFIGGDVNHPVIVGSLYNDQDRPPVNEAGQVVLHLPLGAADSDAVRLEVRSGQKREVTLRLGDGLVIRFRDDDPVVEVEAAGGKAVLKIDRDGTVSLSSQAKVNLDAPEINIKATGQLNLKGDAAVNIN
jgi:phage baseplate assembly protein gpV